MEQILLYIVTISGFSGFMLGLYSLLIPVLQRRGVRLPFVSRAHSDEDEFDYEDDDKDAQHFAATSFSARRGSLLDRLPSRSSRKAQPEEDEEADLEDEGLLGDLDLSNERAEVEAEDEDEDEDDELAELTFEAEVDPVLEELARDEDLDAEDEEDGDEEGEDEEEGEYEDDEEEEEPEKPVVQVVSGGGSGNDMLALFNEGSNVVKEIETWRADLPDPTMEELLAEAREISAMLKGRRSHA